MLVANRIFVVAAISVAAILCAAGTTRAEDEATAIYAEAAEHFRAESWAAAIAQYRRLLESSPKHALADDARFYLAESLVRSGKPQQAVELWGEYLKSEHDPARTVVARFRLGECLYLSGKFAEAAAELKPLLDGEAAASLRPRVRLYLGNAAAQEGDFKAAIEYFDPLTTDKFDVELRNAAVVGKGRALLYQSEFAAAWDAVRPLYDSAERSAEIVEAAWVAAAALERLGRREEALAAHRRFLALCDESDERRFEALWAAARLLQALSQNDEADAAYRQLAADFPRHPQLDDLLYHWAWLSKDRKEFDKSVELFQRLASECPQSRLRADALYRAGDVELQRGRNVQAVALLDAAATCADKELLPTVLLAKSRALLAMADCERAEAVLEALVKLSPPQELLEQAKFWRAEAAFQQGEWDLAADRFTELLAARPADASLVAAAHLRRTTALVEGKRWAEASESAVAGKQAAPAQAYEFDYLLGRAHAARAEFREAREAYARVPASPQARETETAALAQFMTAETFFHQRDYAAAVDAYRRVAGHGYVEWQAASLLQIGKCHELLGRPNDARAVYEQLLAKHASSAFADEARRRSAAALHQAENAASAVQRK